jgi:prevent-host-death family protein
MDGIEHILPVTKVKKELLELLRRMEDEQSSVALTRDGEPVGVLLTPKRYEALMETIEVLSDRVVLQALATSAADFAAGRVLSHEEVWGE